MKNLAAVDLSTVYAFLLLGAKKLLSLIKFLIRNPGSRAGPLRGAATNLRAADLSTVRTFPSFAAKRWKIWKHKISALYMFFHVLATNVKAVDLSTVNVFPLFSSKKLATKNT